MLLLLWVALWQLAGALFVFGLACRLLQGTRFSRTAVYAVAFVLVVIWFLLGVPWMLGTVFPLLFGQH